MYCRFSFNLRSVNVRQPDSFFYLMTLTINFSADRILSSSKRYAAKLSSKSLCSFNAFSIEPLVPTFITVSQPVKHGTYTYTKGKNCKVSSLNSLRKLVFQIPDYTIVYNSTGRFSTPLKTFSSRRVFRPLFYGVGGLRPPSPGDVFFPGRACQRCNTNED